MWLLLIPAAILGYFVYEKVHAAPVAEKPGTPPATPPVVTPGAKPGLGTIDGHGTGVITEAPGVPPGILQVDPLAAAAAAAASAQQAQQASAAAQAASQVNQLQNNPAAAVQQAAIAAEVAKQEIIAALNTPETDRTPEQAALLSGLASLPTA